MKKNFCVGVCPFCDGNGLLLVVKDDEKNEIYVSCDEAYHEFLTPKDALEKKILPYSRINNVSVDLEVALKKGWSEYIYILEKGKWLKYTDKTKKLI